MAAEHAVSEKRWPDCGADAPVDRPAAPQLAVPGTTVNERCPGAADVSSVFASFTNASTLPSIVPASPLAVPQVVPASAFCDAAVNFVPQAASLIGSGASAFAAAFE